MFAIIGWMLLGGFIAFLGLITWMMVEESRPDEETRKAIGKKILTDLLMLHDIEPHVTVLPKGYASRINGWLNYGRSSRGFFTESATGGSYRELAKLLHDLVHPTDLDGEVPLLPAAIQERIGRWLDAHRKALTAG